MNSSLAMKQAAVDSKSAAAALAAWQLRRDETISANLLFGVTRSAWYAFEVQLDGCTFRTTHPAALERGFVALNVPVEIYHWWDTTITQDIRYLLGDGALVEVPRPPLATAGGVNVLAAEYVWLEQQPLLSQMEATQRMEVEHCGWADQLPYCDRTLERCTFFVPYVQSAVWDRAATLRLALRQFLRQMAQTKSRTGVVGLAALSTLAQALRSSTHVESCRGLFTSLSIHDSCCGRDQVAAFLREAACVLGAESLLTSAALYEEVAAMWRDVTATAAYRPAHVLAAEICAIHAREGAALRRLEEAI